VYKTVHFIKYSMNFPYVMNRRRYARSPTNDNNDGTVQQLRNLHNFVQWVPGPFPGGKADGEWR
jgi:hypothetical protein